MFINLLDCKGEVLYNGPTMILGKIKPETPDLSVPFPKSSSAWTGHPSGFSRPKHPEFIIILKNKGMDKIDSSLSYELNSRYNDGIAEFFVLLRKYNNRIRDGKNLFFSIYTISSAFEDDDESTEVDSNKMSIYYAGADNSYNQPTTHIDLKNDNSFVISSIAAKDHGVNSIAFSTHYDFLHYNINKFNWNQVHSLLKSRMGNRLARNYIIIPSNTIQSGSTIIDEAPPIKTVDEIMTFCGLNNKKSSKIETLISGFENLSLNSSDIKEIEGKKFLLTFTTQKGQSPVGFRPCDMAYSLMSHFKIMATMQVGRGTVRMLVRVGAAWCSDAIMNLYSLLDTSKDMVYTHMVAAENANLAIEKMSKSNA